MAARDRVLRSRAMPTLVGTVVSVVYCNEGNGFVVADLHVDQRSNGHSEPSASWDPPDALERITGVLPGIREGALLKVEGEYRVHHNYGRQFSVHRHRFIQPTTEEGLIGFLGSGLIKGVGEATARQMVGRFGKRTLEVLDSEPERLAELKGISLRKARSIGNRWREVASERELAAYLQELGVTLSLARRIRQEFGANAVQVLKHNPYVLTRMQGIGFQRADQMALAIGIKRNDPSRLRTALQYVLGEQTAREGHVFLPEHELVEEALKQVGPPATRDEVQAQLELLIRDEDVIATEVPGHTRWQPQTDWTSIPADRGDGQGGMPSAEAVGGPRQVYPPWNYHNEKDLADRLLERIRRPETSPLHGHDFEVQALLDAAAVRGTPLNQGQQEIVSSVLAHPFTILTGGPGTGKTTTIRTILELCETHGLEVLLAAPTGRAAKRMQEASGHDARTLHRLLEIVSSVLAHPFTILTGGPGTGKTTTIRTILELCETHGLEVLLAAPTGRAAKRMQEASGHDARTLHRLLEVSNVDGSLEFDRNEDNPLDGDLLIVDEVSMLDVHLASHLVRAVPASMHMLWVGDVDQLPSVGSGTVLYDTIRAVEDHAGRVGPERSGARVTRLTEIFRQAADSAIVTNAHEVREGRMPVLDNGRFRDFFFMPEEDAVRACSLCTELVQRRLPKFMGLHPSDIMVLSPMRRGPIGTVELNRTLQAAINGAALPSVELANGQEFRPRDPVMQTRNDYDKKVFNGDLGHVVRLDPDKREALVDFEGRRVQYESDELNDLTLAYAMTIHKSQGSEYKAVVLPMMKAHSIMLRRNLLYTALTRAGQLVVIVGQKAALRMAVNNHLIRDRHTALLERLALKLSRDDVPEDVPF